MNRSTRSPRREPPPIQELPSAAAGNGFIAADSPLNNLFSGEWSILVLTFFVVIIFLGVIWFLYGGLDFNKGASQSEEVKVTETPPVGVDTIQRTPAV